MVQERATWRAWLILIVVIALQTTWLSRLILFGVHLDLPLLSVISVSLSLGWETGVAYGLVAGLLTGYCSDAYVGSFAFSRAVVGGVLGVLNTHFARDNPLVPPLCAMGGVLLANVIFLIMCPTEFSVSWWVGNTINSMFLHMLFIWPVHFVIGHLVLLPERSMFASNR
ncbi:MAG: hypothetical protein JO316_11670 [Abitibacteriaceae bacterium]|nr:hypothetical protein [Abditibacteriaceae bacterium]MBV9866004.1 hypothetical protein [Abditibacteriaceae bacterium]